MCALIDRRTFRTKAEAKMAVYIFIFSPTKTSLMTKSSLDWAPSRVKTSL
jgi:hypothetical protein